MVLGRQAFSASLVLYITSLSAEDKAKMREALYEWLRKRNEKDKTDASI